MANVDVGTDFVKQLAFENANAAYQLAIHPYKKKMDLTGYISLCSDIGAAYLQCLAMAAVIQGFVVNQFLSQQNKSKCFNLENLDILPDIAKIIQLLSQEHLFQNCVPDVKEENIGLVNVSPRGMPRVNL